MERVLVSPHPPYWNFYHHQTLAIPSCINAQNSIPKLKVHVARQALAHALSFPLSPSLIPSQKPGISTGHISPCGFCQELYFLKCIFKTVSYPLAVIRIWPNKQCIWFERVHKVNTQKIDKSAYVL